jgi:hypothetical protein
MSQDDIDRLINERHLVRESFDDGQVAGFWSKAVSAVADARVADISADTALQIAYRACLQATLAVLAAKGLRVKSTAGHYKAFYAMQKLDDALRPIAIGFDELRTTRSESVYEPTEDEAELKTQLSRALAALDSGLPVLREWTISVRPTLTSLLARPRRQDQWRTVRSILTPPSSPSTD